MVRQFVISFAARIDFFSSLRFERVVLIAWAICFITSDFYLLENINDY